MSSGRRCEAVEVGRRRARRLDISLMQALHSTANTFGLAALLGWDLALPRVSSRTPAASASGSTEPPQR